MATRQDLYQQVQDVQRERAGYGARRGVEQLRRTAAGALGQSSQQILAGTPVEFQPEMGQKERLQLQAMIAEMMSGIGQIEQLREQEVSVSQREMSNTLAQLARTQADLVGKVYQTRGGQRTAQINSASVRFAEEMKRIEKIRDTAGYHGKYTAGDRNDMRQQIQEEFSSYVKARDNPNTGETQLVIIEEDLAFGRTSTRMGETFEWAKDSGGGNQYQEIGQIFEEVFKGLPERDRALFVAEFPSAFNGLSVEDFLLPESSMYDSGKTDREAMQEQRAGLKNVGIEVGALYSMFDKAGADLEELHAADEAANEMAERNTQALLSTMDMVGVPQDLMAGFKDIMQTAEDVARGNIGKKQWAGPPPPQASAQEKTAWIQKEVGPEWLVTEDGTIGQAGPGGEFFAADDGTGNPVNFSAIAPAPDPSQGGQLAAGEEWETGGSLTQPEDFTSETASMLQTMWKELQSGAKGGALEEFMKEPAFLQWAKEMQYIDENSSESEKRWAARQLIGEARTHQRQMRGERGHQRDLNILSGKALSRPGQRRRAGRRVERNKSAIARKLGRMVDPGTDAAGVMGAGIGGDGAATSVAPGPGVTEADAAAAGTAAEAASTPAAAVEEAPVDFESNITSREEGDAFRAWVNEKHPDVAKDLDLDASGNPDNSYIREAWDILGEGYEQEQGRAAEEAAAPEVAPQYQYDPTDVAAMEAGMMDRGEDPITPPTPGEAGYAPSEQYEAVDTGEEGISQIFGGHEAGDLMGPIATERGEGRRPPGLVSTPTEFHAGASDVLAARGELLDPTVREVLEGALRDGILNQSQYTALLDQKDPSDLAEAIWVTAKQAGITPSKEYAEILKKHIRRTEFAEDLGTEFDPGSGTYLRPLTMPVEEAAGGSMGIEATAPLSARDDRSLQKNANRKAVFDQLVAEREEEMGSQLALSDQEQANLEAGFEMGQSGTPFDEPIESAAYEPQSRQERRTARKLTKIPREVKQGDRQRLKGDEKATKQEQRRKKRSDKKETERYRKELKANAKASREGSR